jgi:FkbM family methyltransferase
MRSNLPSVPDVEKPRFSRYADTVRDSFATGRVIDLISRLRRKVGLRLEGWLLPQFDASGFMKGKSLEVVDIGAAGGLHTRWRTHADFVVAHLFEPQPVAYATLEKLYRGNDRIRLYQTALSRDDAPVTLNVMAFPGASSVFMPDADFVGRTTLKNHLRPVGKLEIQPAPLDSVIKRADFIKLDVEGWELAILEGASALMPGFLGLELEVGFIDRLAANRPVFGDIDAYCRKFGLVFCKFFETGMLHYELDDVRFESGGLTAAANALYLRLPHEVIEAVAAGALTEDAIWKAALLYMAYEELEFAYVLTTMAQTLNLSDDGRARNQALRQSLARYAGVRWPVCRRTLHGLVNILFDTME